MVTAFPKLTESITANGKTQTLHINATNKLPSPICNSNSLNYTNYLVIILTQNSAKYRTHHC